MRETLFNWLQGAIGDVRCLDLFAGSGALGIEALSRGAAEVEFVERESRVAEALRRSLEALGAERGRVVTADAFRYLAGPPRPFGLVFLDPPFAAGWLTELCTLLAARGWLAREAFIYLEGAAREGLPELPATWEAVRETRAGEVRGVLARCTAAVERLGNPVAGRRDE